MNKRLGTGLLAAAVLSAGGCSFSAQEAEEAPLVSNLHVEDGLLKDEQDSTVVLRGMSTHGLGWYPRYINSASLASLKAEGANVIRLAMYSDANEGYLEEPYNLELLYIGIENAIEQDMYVIVDWHILDDYNPLMHLDEAIGFFKEISEHYKDTPNVIYEICNEPNGETTWDDVYEYAMQVIPVIRENAPDSIIIVGSPEHSTAINEAMERPLPFDNLMYSYHKYIDVSRSNDPEFYWLEQAVEQKFPVFVSEWGIAYKEESYLSENEYVEGSVLYMDAAYQFLDYLEENYISWCGWSLSNDAEIHSAIKHDCSKLSGWTSDDLTPGGRLMFSYFK